MYSPKTDEKLIPPLYHLKENTKIPMTQLVNAMIRTGLQMCEEGIAPIGLKPHIPKRKLHRYSVNVKNIIVTYTATCKSSVIVKLFRDYGFPLRMTIEALKREAKIERLHQ
jgi:hypothetical protein